MLRGLLAESTENEDRPWRPSILEWRATDDIMTFVNSEEAEVLASAPALTGDHLLHTKPWPLFVPRPAWHGR